MRSFLCIGIGILFLCFFYKCHSFLINDKESILSKIMNRDGDEKGDEGISICPICQMVLSKLLSAVKGGYDTNMIANEMGKKCIELNIAPATICSSIIPLFKLNNPNMRIVHLTDFHYDPLYKEGANVVCPELLCCRQENGMAGFNVIAAGKFGYPKNCDLPKTTLISLFKHLASIQDQFDMVICTGDLPPHDVWRQSNVSHIKIIHEITEMFQHYLPQKKVFFAIGNHESVPVNNFPPPYIKSTSSPHWLYSYLSKAWSPWLPSDTEATIKKGAFYSISPYNGLRIISLNTNFCYRLNFWLLVDSKDPAGQLKWLVSELQKAEDHGEKVYIIGHIAPGDPECLSEWQRNYFKILSRYENTVAAQFFGHTHSDSFQVSYNQQSSQPETIAYITGSVTPHTMLNPGFRIYHIDANRKDNKESTWTVIDHENYILNLTEANISKKAQWKLEYRAKEAYKMTSLLPADWSKVIKNMESDDNLFQKFYRNYHKSYPVKACSSDCKKMHMCALRFDYKPDSNSC